MSETSRRQFVAYAFAALAAPRAARAQQPGQVHRIGVLGLRGSAATAIDLQLAFFQGLRDLGWVEGHNVVIERRYSDRPEEPLTSLVADLIRLNVEVILAAGGPASLRAARQATTTIPIVMVGSSRDPIGTGLIQSYARPGGNITGITTSPEELTGKQLELLKAVGLGSSRLGFLWDATVGPFRVDAQTAKTAQALGMTLIPFEVRGAGDLGAGVAAAAKERVGGLILPGSPMFVAHRREIAALLTKHQLPAVSIWRSFADAGVLMSYGPDLSDEFRRAASYVDKILRGAKPGELPVERPTKFDLVINVKTAKALGVTIPPSLLLRADQVIE